MHIGMHKTGSTSIQHFFSRSRRILPLFGLLYPPSFGADGRSQPKHNAIFSAVSHEADFGAPHPVLGPSASLIERTAERFRRSRAHTCVLSAEGFSGEKPDFARALASLGDEFDVTVIVFLRRPDIWLEKFHRQMIISREVRETRGIEEFAALPATALHIDYFAILDWWANAFGSDAIRMLPYREDSPVGVVPQFLAEMSAPAPLKRVAGLQRRRNRSADDDTALAALRGNRSGGAVDSRDLRLGEKARVTLASRLKRVWSERGNGDRLCVKPPPFIFSMLDQIQNEKG